MHRRVHGSDGASVVLADIQHERAREVAGSLQERGLEAGSIFVRR